MIQSFPEGPDSREPIVVDTNVVSYVLKGDTRATGYLPQLTARVLVLSFMTVAELDAWAEINRWGQRRRQRMERFLAGYTIHFPDRRLCRLWAAVMAEGRRAGRPILAADGWIAATALRYGVPLVTHNPSDFVGVSSLTIISEQSA
jgi:tRNA(fMet)-specific endonuclease VapC